MTPSFFTVNADGLQFLAGLAFFVLAAVSFSLKRIPTPLLSWSGLGWFGLLFGCRQWLEGAELAMGRLPVLEGASTVLLAGASLGLLLFAAKEMMLRWMAGRWLRFGVMLLPPAVLLIAVQAGGLSWTTMFVMFSLGALVLYNTHWIRQGVHFPDVVRRPLGLATITLLLLVMAMLAGFPSDAACWTAWLNRDRFAGMTGFPITCVYIVLALALSAALWQIYACTVREATRGLIVRGRSWFGPQMAGVCVLLAAGGWLATQHTEGQARARIESELMGQAEAIAASLDARRILSLTGTLSDTNTPDYIGLRDILTRIQRSNPDLHNVYLYGPREGKSINYVASDTPGEADILPGTIYADELDAEDRAFFRTGIAYVSRPYVDRWGTWVSALVGMIPNRGGADRLRIGLGVDMSAGTLSQRIAEARLMTILQLALVSVILVGFIQSRQTWWDRTRKMQLNQAVVLELAKREYTTLAAAMEHLSETLAAALNVEYVSIWRYAEDRKSIECEAFFTRSTGNHDSGEVLKLERYPLYFRELEARSHLAVPDVRTEAFTSELARDYFTPKGILSLVDAQILQDGVTSGILCVEHTGTIRFWSEEEIQLVMAIVDMLALHIEKDEKQKLEGMRHASEERYSRIFEHSPEAIIVLDTRDGLVELNRRAEAFIGHPASALAGQGIGDWPCFVSESRSRIREQLAKLRQSGEIIPCEIELLTQSGERRDGLFDAAPLRAPGGLVTGYLVIISDITRNKRNESILKGTLRELERHNRLMSGREARILELKREVNALLLERGLPPAYQSVAAGGMPKTLKGDAQGQGAT